MARLRAPLGIVLLTALLQGCYTLHAIDLKKKPGKTETHSMSHFLFGNGNAVVKTGCKKGFYSIEEGYTFADGMLNLFTLFLYNPRTAKVVCAK